MDTGRRSVLKGAALGGLVFSVGGVDVTLTPRQARAQGVAMQVLTQDEREALEALADTILPGAPEAGVAAYVDHQLAGDPGDALLIARVLNVPPPILDFYRAGLTGLDSAARTAGGGRFAELPATARVALLRVMMRGAPPGWHGPPAPFFYIVSRNDAIDVVYGTVEGFEKLAIPYMAHIMPNVRW